MASQLFWAHSAGDSDRNSRAGWQPLAEHLEHTAGIAAQLAALARPGDGRFASLARAGGLLHDYGKYTAAFQRRITANGPRCPHAIYGAYAAHCGVVPELPRPALTDLALAIAGHHAGLPNLTGTSPSLRSAFKEDRCRMEALAIMKAAGADCSGLRQAFAAPSFGVAAAETASAPSFDLTTRMLFSCLVDADRLDTSGRPAHQEPLPAAGYLERLKAHIGALARRAPEGELKRLRASILNDCLQGAARPGSLFSLSVPTGGGKTLSAMAFALQRAVLRRDRYRRVIVVIPYLSIIEQNAQVYADVFGPEAILEHHSGSQQRLQPALLSNPQPQVDEREHYVPAAEPDEDDFERSGQRSETENWDAPLIVTTSVRFFESLFSNRPRDLRRIHNIARSIVILDEVQTIPRSLLAPLLGMVRELAADWGVDFVLSTATQPAFEQPPGTTGPRWPAGTLTEIVSDRDRLRRALRRVNIRWEIDRPISWPALAARMLDAPQALAIVNLRRHAAELFAAVDKLANERGIDPESVFHLSTRMCAAHRLRVLAQIRGRLDRKLPCYVVSTQLVEAGVDVDFPRVFRAIGPLDSIIQAAGRADREGRLTAALGRPGGEVVVFLPEDNKMPPNEYAEAAALTLTLAQAALQDGGDLQVDSASAIERYFTRYYGVNPAQLGSELAELRAGNIGKFADLASEFEMISTRTRDVFVPDDEEARAAIADLIAIKQLTFDLRRRLQRHTVGLSPSEFRQAAGVVYELAKGSEIWIAADGAYDSRLGLLAELSAASLIVGPEPT